ncbi:MAG: hypothetical protein WCB12_15835 [Bryobacteraceae bacterium]
MQYPEDFPLKSRAAVAAEKLRTGSEFDQAQEYLSRDADIEEQIRKYILRQFLVFVREASKLGKAGIWRVDRVESDALEFLRHATIDAVYSKRPWLGDRWISRMTGQLTSEILRQFEKSSEWPQYQEMLLEVAEAQDAGTADSGAEALAGPARRRGYRAEVRQWMVGENLRTVADAAKRLGISQSTLKSIMSSRGIRRYGEQTLNRVLEILGVKHP